MSLLKIFTFFLAFKIVTHLITSTQFCPYFVCLPSIAEIHIYPYAYLGLFVKVLLNVRCAFKILSHLILGAFTIDHLSNKLSMFGKL